MPRNDEWVQVPRQALEIVLNRYTIGDTNADERTDWAVEQLENALGTKTDPYLGAC